MLNEGTLPGVMLVPCIWPIKLAHNPVCTHNGLILHKVLPFMAWKVHLLVDCRAESGPLRAIHEAPAVAQGCTSVVDSLQRQTKHAAQHLAYSLEVQCPHKGMQFVFASSLWSSGQNRATYIAHMMNWTLCLVNVSFIVLNVLRMTAADHFFGEGTTMLDYWVDVPHSKGNVKTIFLCTKWTQAKTNAFWSNSCVLFT